MKRGTPIPGVWICITCFILLFSALGWSWDGHSLTLGMGDGSVVTVAAETGAVEHRASLFPDGSPVIQVEWAHTDLPADQMGRLLPSRVSEIFPYKRPTSEPAPVGLKSLGPRQHPPWPKERPPVSIIACLSASGKLALCTETLLPLAAFELKPGQAEGDEHLVPLNFRLSQDLGQAAVLFKSDQGPSALGSLWLQTYDLSPVSLNLHVIHRWAHWTSQLNRWMSGWWPRGCMEKEQY